MPIGSLDDSDRITRLERRLRRTQALAVMGFCGVALLGAAAWRGQPPLHPVVRTRALIIEDSSGAARVVLSAPVPDSKGGARRSAATGLVINDAAGQERFGVGLNADGSVSMGFDAPPTTGSRVNRERLTLAVSRSGNGEIRFLDREATVRAHMTLFNDNAVALFFTDYGPNGTLVTRVSAKGDTTVLHRR
ncbi:MAG: hypothetical protein ACR2G6_09650 [Gemmatimonadaceae bacterium]